MYLVYLCIQDNSTADGNKAVVLDHLCLLYICHTLAWPPKNQAKIETSSFHSLP